MIYDQIINILMVAFGVEIVRLYFQVFCWKRRNPHKARWIVWVLYISFQIAIMVFNASHPFAILMINILLAFLICKLTYDVELKLAVFLAGTLYVVWMLVEGSNQLCTDIDGSCITGERIYRGSCYLQDCYVYSVACNEPIYKSRLYG